MNNALKQNPSFQLYSDVKSIAVAFNQQTELKYFWFGRIYPNDEFFGLATDHQWPEDYLQHNGADISITAREYYCLKLLAHGRQFKSIARELTVSPRTIETHFERIKKKLNLSTREELTLIYWKNKI